MSSKQTAKPGATGKAESSQHLYEQMFRIRRFEERTRDMFLAGEVVGAAHSAVGQEAVAVGAAAVLRPDDYIAGSHRSHGHLIARGADPYRMFAELLGRETGYCKGIGGSMHIADVSLGILGCNGIVGAGLPIATGAALAAETRGTDQVAVVFFGDGAANQGLAHEAMNLAAVWALPTVFICENNQFQLSAGWRETRVVEDIAARGAGYGIESAIVDGNDVLAMIAATEKAVDHARAGRGPYLLEAKTYRRHGHSMRPNLEDIRDAEEFDAWVSKDPLTRLEARLAEDGVLEEEVLEEIRERVERELEEAIVAARKDPVLPVSELDALILAPAEPAEPEPTPGARKLQYTKALNEALHQEMAADGSVVVLGEDIAALGGIFTVTAGLLDEFGPKRVRNTPISEGGFTGAAVGAAMTGLRPVIEFQFFDFITCAMDSIINQAAKLRYMTGGQTAIPMVVRGPAGGGIRMGAQHSQSLESWFANTPGLKVVAPSGPYDAKGLMAAAIRDDNPVIFLEPKSLLFVEEEVPEDPYAIEIGKAAVKRDGSDVTLVATMGTVPMALRAATRLDREGISVEVIDPRTIFPLDLDTILGSVAKTNQIVIANEAVGFCDFAAEISARVAEQGFDHLDAPIVRVAAPHRPMPYQKDLEAQTIPDADDLVDAIRSLG